MSAAEACAKVAATAGTGRERDRHELWQLMELRDIGRIAAEPDWAASSSSAPATASHVREPPGHRSGFG